MFAVKAQLLTKSKLNGNVFQSKTLSAKKPSTAVVQTSLVPQNLFLVKRATSTTHLSPEQQKKIDELKRSRPISPHLTIYKLQLTSALSLGHRASGILLTIGSYAIPIALLFTSAPFPVIMASLKTSALLTGATKFCVAFPLVFHTFTGIRHLIWDKVKMLEINEVNQVGSIILAASVGLSVLLAFVSF
eukprot:TRINITY_DN21_c0_g1_i1.p1 TRINITY_DN21_c0_g1~~TRINITY_DN21_c0_g1_i1.p1  ORF type:complete len:212 (-),score=96.22 TRINITY_DN21_c0_g1_i1:101-667(-)